MAEYDDKRYLELLHELGKIISELLNMEGNTENLIRGEIDNIFEMEAIEGC